MQLGKFRAFLIVYVIVVIISATMGIWWQSMLTFAGITAIASLGMDLAIGYAGQITLAQPAFVAIGAYSSAILTTRCNVHPLLGVVAGLVIAGLFSYFLAFPLVKLRGFYLGLATLGFAEIVSVINHNAIALTRGTQGITMIPYLSIGPFLFDSALKQSLLVWFVNLFLIFLCSRLGNSRVGRAYLAIRGDEIAASVRGVDIRAYRVQAVVICGLFGAFAGSLNAHVVTTVCPESFSMVLLINYLAIIIVGGLGTFWGPTIGAVIFNILPELLPVPLDYMPLIFTVILGIMLLYMPNGIYGSVCEMLGRFRLTDVIKWKN